MEPKWLGMGEYAIFRTLELKFLGRSHYERGLIPFCFPFSSSFFRPRREMQEPLKGDGVGFGDSFRRTV